ncbi:MAG: ParB/RepB/Spo0J family partition protein [Clostridia bacterium]|nr:ParB/RepB/Spo0J family partition protein [Clostridia bacterium]
MQNKKGGLGRGLDALFNDNATDRNDLIQVKLIDIEPNKEQPRKDFDEKALAELSDSIKEHGLLQPIIVKPLTNGTYRIIAGERRWRASRMAGLDTVPVIIKDFDEKEVMEVALIENLQREDLNPVEEAMGYRALMDTFGMTQEQVAQRVGKSRSAIANALRLLTLRPQELELLRNGKITAGHARALLAAADALTREQMAEMAANGASVHELERIARASHRRKTNREPSLSGSGFYAEVELALKEALHRKVKVTKLGEDHGAITIEFYGDEELRDIAAKLGKMY